MQHLFFNTTLPYLNLAREEYLLTKCSGDFFFLWQNEASVIIGCHQNAYSEVKTSEAQKQEVKIARRMTGGGAVYHDLGNVNFSLVRDIKRGEQQGGLYDMLCRPLIKTLQDCGLQATFSGRNDVLAHDKKIAGCAVHKHGQRILVHGAMLYCADLSQLANLLTPHNDKFADKAVKSVSSRVANVCDLLPHAPSLDEFVCHWADNAVLEFGGKRASLPDEYVRDIQKLSDEKYATQQWIFGRVMPFSFSKRGKTGGGVIEVQMRFDNCVISSIRFFGDFFGTDVHSLEKHLEGCPYDIDFVSKKLNEIDLSACIYNVRNEELLELMF